MWTAIILAGYLWGAQPATCPVPVELQREDTMHFNEAFDKLMEWEGGGQLHRDSRGIPTKWGVAATAHPDVDVENLDKDEAMRIARESYWKPARVPLLPEPIRYSVFDFAYNAGTARAVETLQAAMNDVVRARGYDWPALALDGMPGPKTVRRALALGKDAGFVRRCFVYHRMDFYAGLVRRDPQEYGGSLNGWLRRAMEAA